MIYISKSIVSNYPRPAYNNSIINFSAAGSKASIDFANKRFYITSPYNDFWFNFKDVIKVAMNGGLFKDNSTPVDGLFTDYDVFQTYSVNLKSYSNSGQELDSATFTAKFLKSAVQVEEDVKERFFLHDDVDNEHHFDVWQGLPFGVSLFKNVS